MTREEVLKTMGQILFALEDSKCPEARMAEQIIEWIEGLPIAVPMAHEHDWIPRHHLGTPDGWSCLECGARKA